MEKHCIRFIMTRVCVILSTLSPTFSFAQYYWEDETGGIYNIPSVEFNPVYTGYGSDGDLIYNKIDLQTGQTMQIVNSVPLYDHLGNEIATAWASPIGWDHENEFRDGGIIAAAITEIQIGSTTHTMVYAWSVNSNLGRQSGWIKLSDLSPSNLIEEILLDNKAARMNILRNGGIGHATYEESSVGEAYLPAYAEEYYLDPGRDASYTAGKARYYYTKEDGYNSGLINIPETGRQRYGVAHVGIPINDKFFWDRSVPRVNVSIYPPSSTTPINHKLRLAWGYTLTSAGDKIYSWVNERALTPTGVTVTGSTVVHITKRNASGYALDGGQGSDNRQNIYLSSADSNNINQQWLEIYRGDGYYSYQKMASNHCINGMGGGANRQNIYLWTCNANNQNQHWQKVDAGGGAYKLVKRNASGFAINGGGGGSDGQNVNLYDSSHSSQNLQWFVTPLD